MCIFSGVSTHFHHADEFNSISFQSLCYLYGFFALKCAAVAGCGVSFHCSIADKVVPSVYNIIEWSILGLGAFKIISQSILMWTADSINLSYLFQQRVSCLRSFFSSVTLTLYQYICPKVVLSYCPLTPQKDNGPL